MSDPQIKVYRLPWSLVYSCPTSPITAQSHHGWVIARKSKFSRVSGVQWSRTGVEFTAKVPLRRKKFLASLPANQLNQVIMRPLSSLVARDAYGGLVPRPTTLFLCPLRDWGPATNLCPVLGKPHAATCLLAISGLPALRSWHGQRAINTARSRFRPARKWVSRNLSIDGSWILALPLSYCSSFLPRAACGQFGPF